MAVFTSEKPLEEETEMSSKLETSTNPFENSFSLSSDWYLGSDSMSWSGSYQSDDEFGMFDWVNVISDDSSSDEEFPVNIASVPVGFVLSVKGKKVIVEGKENINLLKGSFLWVSETRAPLGCVDKVFGTVKKPCFRVRLQVGQGIKEGAEVSIIVEDFVQQEKNGCVGDVVDEVQLTDDDEKEKLAKEVLGLEKTEELTVQVRKGICHGTPVSLGEFIRQNLKGCVDASSSHLKIFEVKLSDDDIAADCKLMQTKNMEKNVSGLEKSEDKTVVSPNRPESEKSPVKSQAIAETSGIVPNRSKSKNLQTKKLEKYVLAFEKSDSEVSPLKSQAIAETGGEQSLPRMGKFVVPRRSESSTNQQKAYQPPMTNKLGGITPKPVSTQPLMWTRPTPSPTPYTQPRYRRGPNQNNQQPFGGMQKSYQNPAPWPRVNAYVTQPQSLNAKPSSDRGKAMLAYHRGVGEGRGFGLGRGRVVQDQA